MTITNKPKYIDFMTGYKATDANLTCNPDGKPFTFEVGQWYECEGELIPCANGFHFCEQPSGPWAYYQAAGTRIWKVEAKMVLEVPKEPGADFKRVARFIRLVEEIIHAGDYNTGDYNTGYRNTGDYNTGNRNTGYRNTGYRNTGDYNTGGYNTGGYNTGNYNTGNRNTGNGNACNYSAGFFCSEEPKVICFDKNTGLTRNEFEINFPEYQTLCCLLQQPEPIKFDDWKHIPGITAKKLKALHAKHLAGKEGR